MSSWVTIGNLKKQEGNSKASYIGSLAVVGIAPNLPSVIDVSLYPTSEEATSFRVIAKLYTAPTKKDPYGVDTLVHIGFANFRTEGKNYMSIALHFPFINEGNAIRIKAFCGAGETIADAPKLRISAALPEITSNGNGEDFSQMRPSQPGRPTELPPGAMPPSPEDDIPF